MKSINEIASRLNWRTPDILPIDDHRASVAAVLCENAGVLELLFIERATVKNDPWSGHIAFPGGHKEDIDAGVRETAERETLEELGLDLGTGRYLGQLDDLSAHIAAINVSGFVYHIERVDHFMCSQEVHRAFWFPVQSLADHSRYRSYKVPGENPVRHVPAIDLLGPGHKVLWGLTYRFVTQLLEIADIKLPKHYI